MSGSPGWAPATMVGVAVRALPGEHRDRYRHEFRAELFDMTRRQQFRFATGVLIHAPSLRGSLLRQPVAVAGGEMIVVKPMLCLLNVKHRWRLASSEDGESRFYRCERCGKERFPVPMGPIAGA